MTEIGTCERWKLDNFLRMGEGFILNFSDRAYTEFFIDFQIDIDSAQYRVVGDAKAKRMRTFWDIAPNHTTGEVLEGRIVYGLELDCLGDSNP
ncbi:hypothetical protein PcP3B5_25480 [Pseudomonas citronellolis]|nr:hypothetical protein PcP3B5_25480 [Pseudomonas citronellolis]